MKQENGKAIQSSTVVGHLTEALMHGKPLDMSRFVDFVPTLTQAQWDRIGACAAQLAPPPNDICISTDFKQKDLLRVIIGAKVDKEFAEKTESDQAEEKFWYDRIRLVRMLRCIGFAPTFGPAAKRARAA